jgi:ketosteroid isomerase-like protein
MKQLLLGSLAVALLATALPTQGDIQAAPGPVIHSSHAKFDLAALRKLIEANNARFTHAHVTGDQALIDAMFTEDATSLPPESPPVIGRAAISKLTTDYLAYGVHEFTEETTDFYGNEDLLIDQGNYVMVYGKDRTVEKGKYLNVWQKEDGTWKIRANIWNTNAAPSPAK